MDTEDWCGLIVRTRAALRFGVVVGVVMDGPHTGRLCVLVPILMSATVARGTPTRCRSSR
jgi:hypothetical protein